MKQLLRRLLNRLERVAESHPEVFDTDVREAMFGAVFDGFVRPRPGFALPDDYAMFSPEGNRAVRDALAEYVESANNDAAEAGLTGFHARLAAFQDGEVVSRGGSYYDDFFGWADPNQFDRDGNPAAG
jgi:hypothetical protein